MKILSIGYYDDFARFFLEIKKEFKKKDKGISFKYLNLYFSGYLYFLVRLHAASFFSFRVWINKILNNAKYQKILKKQNKYKNINLTQIIQYHLLLDENEESNLKLQAMSYIDIVEKELKKFNPDVLILSGDSRMSIEIFNIKAKELNIKTYYFEQGPFGTTIFDQQGVNANSSFRNRAIKCDLLEQEIKTNIATFNNRAKNTKYKRNPIYRGSDYIFQFIFSKIGLLPVDIKMSKEVEAISDEYVNLSKNIYKQGEKIFLLILQVPYDVNMVYHSPFYSNHCEIVKDVFNNLPEGSQLLVREHPLYQGKYEKELFSFMSEHQISLDTNNLYRSIEKADVVIVNNSTVGIEAISKLKPVVVLGDSYYDNDKICLKLKTTNALDTLLNTAINFDINEKDILCFLDAFLNNFLINGHFRDEKLIAPSLIVQRIIDDI